MCRLHIIKQEAGAIAERFRIEVLHHGRQIYINLIPNRLKTWTKLWGTSFRPVVGRVHMQKRRRLTINEYTGLYVTVHYCK